MGKKYTFPLASGFVQKDVWVSITSIHQKVQMINGQDGGMTEMAGKLNLYAVEIYNLEDNGKLSGYEVYEATDWNDAIRQAVRNE